MYPILSIFKCSSKEMVILHSHTTVCSPEVVPLLMVSSICFLLAVLSLDL